MLSIKQYSSEFKAKWDNFVINERDRKSVV